MATIINILKYISQHIPTLDSEIIIGNVLNKKREYLITHSDEKIDNKQKKEILRLTKKRAAGMPVAYIIKNKEFFTLNFLVDKNVLIPRPETEKLVEMVIQNIQKKILKQKQKILLIDVGTGSGCIAVAIAKNIKPTNKLRILATDISKKSLVIAKKNAKKNQAMIKFFHGNLLEPLFIKKNYGYLKNSDEVVITANLPYLTKKQFLQEETIKFEPYTALVSKDGGLYHYKNLFKQIKKLKKELGGNRVQTNLEVFIEIDPSQTEKILQFITWTLPLSKQNIILDYSGNKRFIHSKI